MMSCETQKIVLDDCTSTSKGCLNELNEDEPTPGTISVLQFTSLGYTGAHVTTSNDIDTETRSNFLVFVSRQDNPDSTIVSDNMGNSFLQVISSDVTNEGTGTYSDEYFAFSCFDCNGGANHNFTVTTTNGYSSIFVIEISSSSPLKLGETISSSTGQSTPILSGSINASANSLLVGFAASGEGTPSPDYTWNNGFTKHVEITNTAHWYGSLATKHVSASGTEEASMSTTNPEIGTALLIELTL